APVDVPVGANDKIILKGMNAQVSYSVQPGTPSVRVNGLEEAGWTWEKSENRIHLLGPQADSRRGLEEQLRTPGKRAVVEIVGASAPVEIHLRDGVVNLNKGSHEATVTLRNGKVTALGRSGSLKAQVMKGEVFVSDGSGRVDIDVYQGQLTLRNLSPVEGEAYLFGGQLLVDTVKGTLAVTTSESTAKVQKFNGTLVVENGKGAWTGTALQGRVEGSSAEGSISLQLIGETDVSFKAQSGRVSVQLPKASGASLNLQTREGEISVPSEVRVNRGHLEKSVRGRLRGEAGRFNVMVRSQEGGIVVR
ncbi:MAG TPA: DUF4097 family beta strand repeat-containing protein, partial [Pseudobdellovibrionaceae bacterium]|nr:DUF4097 family beta strand repeat-containing protein [Pseudobdellovibrionaceae bacterium]